MVEGWANLPLHNKVLMAVMLVMILAVIGLGIHFATVNWNRAKNCMDEIIRNLLESVTVHPFYEESHQKVKTIKQHSCGFQ